MIVEIKGGGFCNKAAELRLRAALEKARGEFPEVAPRRFDYRERALLGLYQKVWFERLGIQWGRFGYLLPSTFRKDYGMIHDREVQVLLDVSANAYNDRSGEKPTRDMALRVREMKKRGSTVILMPQATGPFIAEGIRKDFAYIVQNADLVFPRDDVSYEHVVELVGESGNISQYPEFTNILPARTPENPGRYEGRFCLAPNYRRSSDSACNPYIQFCATCLRLLADSGQEAFILVYGGEKHDLELAEVIRDEAGMDVEIVSESDVLKLKGILGLCAGVISSRYQALVGALSQGVPSIACGFSAGYEQLLREYGLPGNSLPLTAGIEKLERHIDELVWESTRRENVALIKRAAMRMASRVESMWELVLARMASFQRETAPIPAGISMVNGVETAEPAMRSLTAGPVMRPNQSSFRPNGRARGSRA